MRERIYPYPYTGIRTFANPTLDQAIGHAKQLHNDRHASSSPLEELIRLKRARQITRWDFERQRADLEKLTKKGGK